VDQILSSFAKDMPKYVAIVGGGINLLDDSLIEACNQSQNDLESVLRIEKSLEFYGPLSRVWRMNIDVTNIKPAICLLAEVDTNFES
jgi:hypothetical protein